MRFRTAAILAYVTYLVAVLIFVQVRPGYPYYTFEEMMGAAAGAGLILYSVMWALIYAVAKWRGGEDAPPDTEATA